MFENGAIKRLISSMKDSFNKTIIDAIEKIFNVSLIFYNDNKNGFFSKSNKMRRRKYKFKDFLSYWDHHPFTSFSVYAKNILFEEKREKNTLVLDKKNTREKINEEKMKNLVRKG